MPPHDPRERIPAGQRVPAAQRIIVALDVESLSAAEAMMDRL